MIAVVGLVALGFCAGGTVFSLLLIRVGRPSAPHPSPIIRTQPREQTRTS